MEHLENERHRINEEIRNYPMPIAGCDEQFSYLLEERARIAQELDRRFFNVIGQNKYVCSL